MCFNMGMPSRAPWHVNRSPQRYAVDTGANVWHLNEKSEKKLVVRL
jgi:hypothetical protein